MYIHSAMQTMFGKNIASIVVEVQNLTTDKIYLETIFQDLIATTSQIFRRHFKMFQKLSKNVFKSNLKSYK